MTIKAVLFDFGGVFTDSPFSAFDDMGKALGAKPGQVSEIMFGPYHEDGDHPWHRLERGEISLEDARSGILDLGRERYALDIDIYQLFGQMARDGGIRKALVARTADLKRDGYVTAIITNNVREFSDGWRSLLPVDELFDVVVDSSMEGVRKPGEEIFARTLSRLPGIEYRDAVFLDDHPANIATAKRLGMRTIHVDRPIDAVITELDTLLKS